MGVAGLSLTGINNALAMPMSSKEWASAKSEKLKIAYIGIGNRGEQNISEFAKTGLVDVVALCDVDMGAPHTQKVMNMYPGAALSRLPRPCPTTSTSPLP